MRQVIAGHRRSSEVSGGQCRSSQVIGWHRMSCECCCLPQGILVHARGSLRMLETRCASKSVAPRPRQDRPEIGGVQPWTPSTAQASANAAADAAMQPTTLATIHPWRTPAAFLLSLVAIADLVDHGGHGLADGAAGLIALRDGVADLVEPSWRSRALFWWLASSWRLDEPGDLGDCVRSTRSPARGPRVRAAWPGRC